MQYFVAISMVIIQALAYSPQANAILVDKGIVTADTISGLDWLDFTETVNLSTSYVSGNFQIGGKFEGWRFANTSDVIGLFNAAGGTGVYDGSYSVVSHNGAATKLLDLMGVTRNENPTLYRMSSVHFSGEIAPVLAGFLIREWKPDSHYDILAVRQVSFATGDIEVGKAHALVRTTVSAVPEPTTAQLIILSLLVARISKAGVALKRGKTRNIVQAESRIVA